MRIQHNIAALNSYRQLGSNNNAVSKNLEKLSSGYRINRAGDDAAGLAISEKMRAQITGLETAQKNAQDGISLVQTAEGALTEVHSMLNRMTELATQSANGTYSSEVDRENLQKEVATLKDEIDRISKSTNFNGIKLLDGSIGNGNADGVSISNSHEIIPGIDTGLDLSGITGGSGVINVDGQKVADVDNIVTGQITPGKNAVHAKKEFFIVDELKATNKGTGSAETTSFEMKLGDADIKFELKSDTAATGESTTINLSDIFDDTFMEAMSTATGTTLTITAGNASDFGITLSGAAELTITLTAAVTSSAGSVKEIKDIANNYSFDYEPSKSGGKSGMLQISANQNHAKKDTHAADFTIGSIGTFAASNNDDENFMLDIIEEEFAGGSTQTVNFGWENLAAAQAGANKVAAQYKMASSEIELDTANLKLLHNKTLTINGKTYVFADVKNKGGALLPGTPSGAGVTTITYSSDLKDTNDVNFIGNKLADAINADAPTISGVTNPDGSPAKEYKAYYDKSDGTIKIQETVQHAQAVVDKANAGQIEDAKRMINDLSFGTDSKELGAGRVDFSNLLLNNKLKADVWVEIDGKKYQFAVKPEDVEPGNIFVKFTQDDAEANAKALLQALKSENVAGKFNNAQVVATGANGDFMIDFGDQVVDLGNMGYKGLSLQVGDTSEAYQKVTVKVDKMDTDSLGIKDVDISEVKGAEEAIGKLRDAINKVSSTRGDLGAVQNRLEHTINNLGVTTENITAAESRIRDTDMAQEMMAYTKNNILVQAAQAMLAQANTVPQGVLQLLG